MKNFSKVLIFVFMFSLVLSGIIFGEKEQEWLEPEKVDAALPFKGDLCKSYYGKDITVNKYNGQLIVGDWVKVTDKVACKSNLRLMDLPTDALDEDLRDDVMWLADQVEYFKYIYVVKPFSLKTYYDKEPYEVTITKYRKVKKQKEVVGNLYTVVDERKPSTITKRVPGKDKWKIVQVKNDKENVSKTVSWRYRTKGK